MISDFSLRILPRTNMSQAPLIFSYLLSLVGATYDSEILTIVLMLNFTLTICHWCCFVSDIHCYRLNMMFTWTCLVSVLFAGGLPHEWAVVQAQSSRPGNTAYLAYLKNLQAGNRTAGPAGLGGSQTYPPFANAQGQEFNKQLRECKFLSCFEYLSSRAH